MSVWMWAAWAVLLIAQNFSFTMVSRARNSGSLARHIKAAIGSNGIWFASQAIAVSQFMQIITGKYGVWQAVAAGLYYTTFTIIGSVLAHHHALKTEKGKAAVGANAKYAQITKEDWAKVQYILDWYDRIQHIESTEPLDSYGEAA
jgi:hypothetical protein